MSKLSEVFKSVCATLHWGPSVEPFHKAVIEEHDALDARVAAIEAKMTAMGEMLAMYEATKQEHSDYAAALQDPAYIEPVQQDTPATTEPAEAVDESAAPVEASEAVAEPVAATSGDKAIDLQASRDPEVAAPDTPEEPDVKTE